MVLSALKAAWGRFAWSGTRYRCFFCDTGLRAFRPYGFTFPVVTEKRIVGGGYRENALCPVCNSLDRERLLYLYLRHKTDLLDGPRKLLHVAPERQVQAILGAKTDLNYVTADFASPEVMLRMDITDIQFPDNSFDAIICNHVLEHVLDDGKAMRELHRVLKPGGWAVLQVPLSQTLATTYEDPSITAPAAREQAFGQNDHVRIYAPADYQLRLERAGFQVQVFDWRSEPAHFGGPENRFGLNQDERVYTVSKAQ